MATLIAADGRPFKRLPANLNPAGGFTGTVPLWTNGEMAEDADGTRRTVSYSEIYETQPNVARVVNKLFRQIATLPLKVYRRKEGGDKERLDDHPLESLLRSPLPFRGPHDLKQWIGLPMLIHGNSLLAKFRPDPDGPPVNLLPMDWRYVSGYAGQGKPIEWWVTTQTGEQRAIKREETVHFAWHTTSGDAGVSPLRQLGVTIKLEDAAQRYSTANFKNAVRPSAAIVLPPETRADKEVREAIREEVERGHASVDQKLRMMIVGGGAEIKTFSHTSQEAELIKARYLNLEEVCGVYDVPGPLVGDLRHGTYSNVEELHLMLYKTILRPWLSLIEDTIKAQLIDPEPEWNGLFCEFDLGEVLRGNRTEEIETLSKASDGGLITKNEARRALNYPPYDDPAADKPLVMANNVRPLGETDPDLPEVA